MALKLSERWFGFRRITVRDQSGIRPAPNRKCDASRGHHFIVDLIDNKVSRPYNYGLARVVVRRSENTSESDSSAQRPDACLPSTVHMNYFLDIVLTSLTERQRRDSLA
jgi:hypothetical protein